MSFRVELSDTPEPAAVEQVEGLREKLEKSGWLPMLHEGLAAAMKPGEKIILLSYGTATIQKPDGYRRVIFYTDIERCLKRQQKEKENEQRKVE